MAKLLDQGRGTARMKHLSYATEMVSTGAGYT